MRCRVTPCSGHHPFGFPNSSGEARDGQGGITEVLEDVEGRISISRKTCNLGVAKSLEQGEEHGGREVGFGASKETDGFMRQLVDQSFLKFFTTSAGLGLLLVPCKALQAATGQVGTDHCEPCLPSLLRFIIEGQANLFDKIGEMRVGVTELAQQATLSDEDTAERRAILKKVGPIFLAVIDGGGNRDVLSEKPCVLGASGVRSIPEEVANGIGSGIEWEVRFGREESWNAQNGCGYYEHMEAQ